MNKLGAFKNETTNHEISALKLVDGLVYSLSNEIYKINKALAKEGKLGASELNSTSGNGIHKVESVVHTESQELKYYFKMKLDIDKEIVDLSISANMQDSDAVSEVKKFCKESGFSLKIDVDSK